MAVRNMEVGKPTDEVCHLWYRCVMAKPSPVARLLALATAAQRNGDAARARKLLDAAIEHMDNDKAAAQQQQQEQRRTKD